MKKAILLCVFAAALAATPAFAGDTYVNDSNPATGINNHFPFNAAWSGANGGWRYQAIYTAAHLGNKPFLITDISLSPMNSGTFSAKDFEVRMSHTKVAPSATFATNLPNPVTVLKATGYSWKLTANTWCPLVLACPFAYNGLDSLTIEVRYRGGAMGGGFTGPVKRVSGFGTRIYKYGTGAFTAATGTNGGTTAWKIRITHADITLSSTSPQNGTTVTMLLDSSADAGKFYFTASSLAAGKIPVGCWTINLAPDGLFFITAMNLLPTIFVNYQGTLSSTGQAKAAVVIPKNPALIGIGVASAFLALGNSGVDAVSPSVMFRIN